MLRTTVLLGSHRHHHGDRTDVGIAGAYDRVHFAIIMNFGSYWFSDKIVLAAYGARPVSEAEAPLLYRVVHNLTWVLVCRCRKSISYLPRPANAFATGRNPQHAAVAVTEGIMRLMNERELTECWRTNLAMLKIETF
jgi:heat shock protein HtpX